MKCGYLSALADGNKPTRSMKVGHFFTNQAFTTVLASQETF
jgi:hypothetical protein